MVSAPARGYDGGMSQTPPDADAGLARPDPSPTAFRPSERRMRPVLLDLWAEIRADWGFVSERLADRFRDARALHSAERRAVAETLYGMVRRHRTLQEVLEAAACPIPAPTPGQEPSPERAMAELLAFRLLFEGASRDDAAGAAPTVDWRRVLAIHAAMKADPDPVRRVALTASLPDWLAERFVADFGADAGLALAERLNGRAPLTLRANRLKCDRKALAEALLAEGVETTPTPRASDGLIATTRTNVFGLRAFKDGLLEVQDEASQLVAELLAPSPGALVVDACAGAGGKTLGLASAMRNRGRLFALDIHAHKLNELIRRARRAGLSNHRAVTVSTDGDYPPEIVALRGRADRVLVDAPCDGVGSMRRHPEVRWRMARAFVDALPGTQLAIALRAADLVRPGGRLVYATCTVFEAENEGVVRAFLEARPDFERVSVREILGRARADAVATPDGLALATTPDGGEHGMDGFYATALRRRGS